MHQKLRVSKYTAVKRLVYSKLKDSLSIYTCCNKIAHTTDIDIPLSQGREYKRISYISGIAQKLSKYENLPPIEIARGLFSHLSRKDDKNFIIQIVSPCWIHLEASHTFLAAWLESLIVTNGEKQTDERDEEVIGDISLPALEAPPASATPHFAVQYAYARCCSLMRLASQEGLIKLRETNLNINEGLPQDIPPNILSPNAISWLDSGEKLRFIHPASYYLIHELVRVVDQLEYSCSSNAVSWEKAALNLSRAFESFWCKCRIFDEVKTTAPELAQARIGLVMATQSVLKFLLEEKLDIVAPQEV